MVPAMQWGERNFQNKTAGTLDIGWHNGANILNTDNLYT